MAHYFMTGGPMMTGAQFREPEETEGEHANRKREEEDSYDQMIGAANPMMHYAPPPMPYYHMPPMPMMGHPMLGAPRFYQPPPFMYHNPPLLGMPHHLSPYLQSPLLGAHQVLLQGINSLRSSIPKVSMPAIKTHLTPNSVRIF